MEIPDGWGPRLQKLLDWIESWQARVEQEPLRPMPGSSLAADDTVFPSIGATDVSYNGIQAAVEYLHLFRSAVLEMGAVYPAAYYTVLRSALMGAAQAVWVLQGPRPKRREHALKIIIDGINQRRKLINDLSSLTDEQRADRDRELTKLAARLSEAQAVATQLGMTFNNITSYTLNMTTVINEAIGLAHPKGTADDAAIRAGAGTLGRTASGHAHGTPSSRLSLVRTSEVVRRPDGSEYALTRAKISEICTVVTAVALLTNEAWRYYNLRCHQHTN